MSNARTAARRPPAEDSRKVCPVCVSAICAELAQAASTTWRRQAAVRARAFHDPSRFGSATVDPGTICQTTRKPLPAVAA